MKFLALTLKNVKSTPLTGNSDQEIQSTVWNTKSFVDRVEIPDVVDAAGNLLSPSMVTGLICRVPKKHGWQPLIYTAHALSGKNPGSPTEGWGQIMSHRGEKTWRTPLPAVENQAFISSPQRHMCKYSRHWQAGYKPLSWTNYWHGLIFKQVIFSLSVAGWPGAGTLPPHSSQADG